MIFRRGSGRYARHEKFFYRGEEVEVVRKYKYLGMLISSNGNFDKHLNEKLGSATIALHCTWKNCMVNALVPLCTKYKVFEATAKSILCYGAQVWGFIESESVEKLLRLFLKRLFRLPQFTPNYMLNLETGLPPLYMSTLKMHFDYVLKILSWSDNRIPTKIAYNTINQRSFWTKIWMELAHSCNLNLDLSLENIASLKFHLYELLQKLDEKFRYQFVEAARASIYRNYYSQLEYDLEENNYFHGNHKVEAISNIFKARGELLSLNFIPHREDLPITCSLCNLGAREDVKHFICICPVLREVRRSIWGTDVLNDFQMFEILNGKDWKKLQLFCKISLAYRQKILQETF